jgi:hypothetical protein
MAKKGPGQRSTQQGQSASKAMVDFAEDLGRLLGTAQAKASNWLNQRKNVIDELTQLRDTANRLLRDLSGESAGSATRGMKRGRRTAAADTSAARATTPGVRRSGRPKMSPAARKAVSRRMRKYWADRRKAKAAQA